MAASTPPTIPTSSDDPVFSNPFRSNPLSDAPDAEHTRSLPPGASYALDMVQHSTVDSPTQVASDQFETSDNLSPALDPTYPASNTPQALRVDEPLMATHRALPLPASHQSSPQQISTQTTSSTESASSLTLGKAPSLAITSPPPESLKLASTVLPPPLPLLTKADSSSTFATATSSPPLTTPPTDPLSSLPLLPTSAQHSPPIPIVSISPSPPSPLPLPLPLPVATPSASASSGATNIASSSLLPRKSIPPSRHSTSLVGSSSIARSISPPEGYSGSGGMGIGMEGPYPSMGGPRNKGKAREEDVRTSQYSNYGGGVESLAGATVGDRESMVGIGRQSILRSGGSLSPGFGTGLNPVPDMTPLGVARSPSRQQRKTSGAGLDSQGLPKSAPIIPAFAAPPPPHLIQQPEICVECMMRDRDMIDIDVTTPGIWSRESDVDLDEWEMESTTHDVVGSEESSRGVGRESRDSHGGRSSTYGSTSQMRSGVRRTKAQPLTVANLKAWTSMNIPASSHRWKTLQVFLNAQLQLIAIERQAREQRSLENGGSPDSRRSTIAPANSAGDPGPRARVVQQHVHASTERLVEQRERQTRDRRSASYKGQPDDARQPPNAPAPAENEYASGDQPWLGPQSRRFSSPALKGFPHLPSNAQPAPPPLRPAYGVRSSTSDLRSNQAAMEAGHDPRRASLWSKFRQSASQSVLSLAPSGSMMEMHLGLSMDKHLAMVNVPHGNLPSESDPALGRHMEMERRRMAPDRQVDRTEEAAAGVDANEPKKKKGLKGFFTKLISGGEKKPREISRSAPTTPRDTSFRQQRSYYDESSSRLDAEEYPLAPPPPLSALANEPRYHQRSASTSSVDSFPQPLSLPSLHPRASSTPVYNPGSASSSPPHPLTPTFPQDYPTTRRGSGFGISADRGSIITSGSGRSGRYDFSKITNVRGPSMDSYSRDIETSTSTSSPPRYPPSLLRSSSPEVLETWTEVSDLSTGGAGPRRSNASIRNSRGTPNLVRREKSLPQLPIEALPLDLSDVPPLPIPTHSFYPNRSTPSSPASRNSFYAHQRESNSAYSIRSPSRSNGASPRPASRQRGGDWGEDEEIVDGSKRESTKTKSRRSIFSLPFALGLGGKKHRPSSEEDNSLYASRGMSEDSRRLRTSEDAATNQSRGGGRSLVY